VKIESDFGPKSTYSCHNMTGGIGRNMQVNAMVDTELPKRCIRSSTVLGVLIALILALGKLPLLAVAFLGMVLISNAGMYVLIYACGRIFRRKGRFKGVRALYAAFLLKLPAYFVLVGLLVHWVGLRSPVLMAMVGGISLLPAVITAKTIGIYLSKTAS
jgi:hypothetical protein